MGTFESYRLEVLAHLGNDKICEAAEKLIRVGFEYATPARRVAKKIVANQKSDNSKR